ncbi:hypothetical protein BDV96DRAFT_571445 [Lophiotrema nucula]|uniref:Uncharacterized protein n=1 Tax=Lophiotrema nucula TaxID=690887 RepID=A0A6A5ZDP3_9PLEO|nr:hypothetical protein BDV96DRAFT_571445 [Lophiotrema nucula]
MAGWKMSTSPVLQQAFAMQPTASKTRRESSCQEPDDVYHHKIPNIEVSDIDSIVKKGATSTVDCQASATSSHPDANPGSTRSASVEKRSVHEEPPEAVKRALPGRGLFEPVSPKVRDRRVSSVFCDSPSTRFLAKRTPTPTKPRAERPAPTEVKKSAPDEANAAGQQHHLPPLQVATPTAVPEQEREPVLLPRTAPLHGPKSPWATGAESPKTPIWVLPSPSTLEPKPRGCSTPGTSIELGAQQEQPTPTKAGPSTLNIVQDDVEVLRCELVEAEAALRVARLQAMIARSSANTALEKQ